MHHRLFRTTCYCVLVAASCANVDDDATSQNQAPPPSLTTVPIASSSDTSPFFDLDTIAFFSGDDATMIEDATYRITAACMATQGFEYPRPARSTEPAVSADPSFPSQSEIQQFGYRWRTARMEATSSTAAPQLSEAAQRALDGSEGHSGCGELAARKIRLIELNVKRQVIANAAADIRVRAQSDARYLDVAEGWSHCMSEAGFTVASVDDAYTQASSADGGFAGEVGMAMAQADYGCRSRTDLTTVEMTVVSELGRAWCDANPQAIADVDAARSETVRLAAAEVANGPDQP